MERGLVSKEPGYWLWGVIFKKAQGWWTPIYGLVSSKISFGFTSLTTNVSASKKINQSHSSILFLTLSKVSNLSNVI